MFSTMDSCGGHLHVMTSMHKPQQQLGVWATHMVTPVDKELAQVAANKASTACHKHTVTLHSWLCFDHCSSGEARRLWVNNSM
jgi:hypothetical protein